MVASHPEGWPAHSCIGPAASSTSFLTIYRTALAISHLLTSPIPIGLTPGFLISVIRQQAVKAASPAGSTNAVANLLATGQMCTVSSMQQHPNQKNRQHHPLFIE